MDSDLLLIIHAKELKETKARIRRYLDAQHGHGPYLKCRYYEGVREITLATRQCGGDVLSIIAKDKLLEQS